MYKGGIKMHEVKNYATEYRVARSKPGECRRMIWESPLV